MKRRFAVMAALPLLMGGCLPLPITIASTAFTGISYMASGKSTTDHVLSATMDQDCALVRPVLGEPFCRGFGPNGEGRTAAVTVATYPGDRDDPLTNEARLAARGANALDLASLDLDSRQIAAAPRYLVAPPHVSIAGIIVTKDQLSPAPGTRVMAAAPDTSWAALAPVRAARPAAAPSAVPAAARMPAPAVAAEAPSQRGSGGDRWVILGSFRDAERAQLMAARYAGREPSILAASVRGGQWHRVALGPMSAESARAVRDGLGEVDGRRPWVVRLETH